MKSRSKSEVLTISAVAADPILQHRNNSVDSLTLSQVQVSQNHNIFRVGRDLWRSGSPTPCQERAVVAKQSKILHNLLVVQL